MLNGTWQLLDVADVEAFTRKALNDGLRAMPGAHLSDYEYEDLLAELLKDIWELSLRYDPAKGHQSFSTYAYKILTNYRVTSWYRKRHGDSRYDYIEIGSKVLRHARTTLGLTPDQLADQLGKSPLTYKRWEKSGKVPLRIAHALTTILGIPFDIPKRSRPALVPEEDAGLDQHADRGDFTEEVIATLAIAV